MVLWPFKKERKQKAFSFIIGLIGLLFTAVGLTDKTLELFNIPLLSVGFVMFIIGLIYLIEVAFN